MNNYFAKYDRQGGIPFMEGATKHKIQELVDGNIYHVTDYGFINGEDGNYAVFCVAEIGNAFYFGNAIITDILREIEADGMKDALREQPVKFVAHTSKRGREYTAMEFQL